MYINLLRNAGTLFVPGLGFLVKGADNRTLRLFWCICGAYYVGIYAECNCAVSSCKSS